MEGISNRVTSPPVSFASSSPIKGSVPLVAPAQSDNPFDTSGESDPFADADPFVSNNASPAIGSVDGVADPFETIQRRIEEKLQSPSGITDSVRSKRS